MDYTLTDVLRDCGRILPEIILILTMGVVILYDLCLPLEKSPRVAWVMLGGLALALAVVASRYGDFPVLAAGNADGFSGMLVVDKLSDFLKVIFLLGTIAVVIFSMRSNELVGYRCGEYYTLMLGAVLGGSFIVSSNNLLMMVLAFETLSLCSYVLAGYLKHNRLSSEASLKYILYGSVASAVMLFGISYIYGMTGTLDLGRVFFSLAMGEDHPMAVLMVFVLIIGGVSFKLTAAPFHFWAPDVYQGSPTAITAFLSVVSKAAGFAVLFRMFLPLFATDAPVIPDDILAIRGPLMSVISTAHLPLLFWILSVTSMTLGNLVALRQTDMKRLLAYSSIAHAGYILMGMTVYNSASLEAMLLYFAVYLFMNMGVFLFVILIQNRTGSTEIASYRGLGRTNPFLFVTLFIFLISLTGLPPTAGFFAKFNLFGVVIGAGQAAASDAINMTATSWFYYSLAIIGAINTAISLYYYMKIAQIMVFEAPREGQAPVQIALFDRVYLLVYTIPVLLLILYAQPVLDMIQLFQR